MSETRDAFFGGRFHAFQPRDGFRAGTDTLFLAASVPAKSGESVLELGAGSGVGLLALGVRVSGLSLWGAELVAANADRANRNLDAAGLEGEVICGDIFTSTHEILKKQYDRVFMNPPFFDHDRHSAPYNPDRVEAHILKGKIGDWIDAGLKRVRAKGTLSVIFPTDFLENIIRKIPSHCAIEMMPIQSKKRTPAKRMLFLIKKQSKEATILHPALIMNEKSDGLADTGEQIARHGLSINWSN